MFRWVRVMLSFVFLLWLIPMGVFIAPAKEKLLCGGQRAICMCSQTASMSTKSQTESRVVVKAVSTVEKESPSSAGHYFLATVFRGNNPLLGGVCPVVQENFYNLVVYRSVDHVPKA